MRRPSISARKALARFEAYTGARDFKTFRREQAIGFKERLGETHGQRTGETLSLATQTVTLSALKEFFTWLAWQPGFKSKIHVPDIDYFSPSMRDSATAKAVKLRDFPSLEQVRAVIAAMPVETVIERRNRALIAFAILTGMRARLTVASPRRLEQIAAVGAARTRSGGDEIRQEHQYVLFPARRRSSGHRCSMDRRTPDRALVRAERSGISQDEISA